MKEKIIKYKILVAEDEKPMAHALELKLIHSGFDPKVVFDGEAALKELEANKYDLLLLDIMMPRLNGFAVLTKLKEDKNPIPVVVSSNLGQEEDFKQAKSLDAADYIIKSDTPIAEIVEKIKKVLKV